MTDKPDFPRAAFGGEAHAASTISDDQIKEWAASRSDDAGRLARQMVPLQQLLTEMKADRPYIIGCLHGYQAAVENGDAVAPSPATVVEPTETCPSCGGTGKYGDAAARSIAGLTPDLVPTGNAALVEAIKAIPRRKEALGGQTLSYVQLGEVLDTIETLATRAVAATPTEDVRALVSALQRAEQFISGFEGDETQEDIDAHLISIRAVLAKHKGGRTDG